MVVSRRHFLEVGSMFATSAAVAANAIAQMAGSGTSSSATVGAANLLTMTQATFKPLKGQVFYISTHTSGVVPVILTSVTSPTAADASTDTFTVTFSAQPTSKLLPQGTYVFRQATLGSFQLFIVPAGQGAPRSYSAVFNHLRQ